MTEYAMAVDTDEPWEPMPDAWAPRLERRHVQTGDPCGNLDLFDRLELAMVRPSCVDLHVEPCPPLPALRPKSNVAAKAARLAEIRATDPDWPHMAPPKQERRPWPPQLQAVPSHVISHPAFPQLRRTKADQFAGWHGTPQPGGAIAYEPDDPITVTNEHDVRADIRAEYETQGAPDIVATRHGVFVATLGRGWPRGILLTLPISESDLEAARVETGRQLLWDDATLALIESTVRSKQESA